MNVEWLLIGFYMKIVINSPRDGKIKLQNQFTKSSISSSRSNWIQWNEPCNTNFCFFFRNLWAFCYLFLSVKPTYTILFYDFFLVSFLILFHRANITLQHLSMLSTSLFYVWNKKIGDKILNKKKLQKHNHLSNCGPKTINNRHQKLDYFLVLR